MQQLKSLLSLLFLSILIACSNNNTATEVPVTDNTTVTETESTNTPPKADQSTLEGFWTMYQEAVQQKDKNKLMEITTVESDELDFYDDFFFEKGVESIDKMTINDFKKDNFQGEEILKFEVDLSDENGQNALIFHINSKDGKYYIGKIRVAGGSL